jgi:hypothetical protein
MQIRPRILSAAAFAALLSLAACNSEPETVTAGTADPDAATLKEAPPVELPPMVTASRTYRCKDNSLVYIDFFNDNVTANLRDKKDGQPVVLKAPEAGKPFVSDGYTLSGNGAEVELTRPGKGSESCKA